MPVPLTTSAVDGDGEEAVGLVSVLDVEGCLVHRGEAEEVLTARLHVSHH
jgi:hypothetical protein